MTIATRAKADTALDNKTIEAGKDMVAADNGKATRNMGISKDGEMAVGSLNPGAVRPIMAGRKDKVAAALRTGEIRVMATAGDMEAGKGMTKAEGAVIPGIVTGPRETRQGASQKVIVANPVPRAIRKAQIPGATGKKIHPKVLPVKL